MPSFSKFSTYQKSIFLRLYYTESPLRTTRKFRLTRSPAGLASDEVVSLAKAAMVDTSIRTRFGTQFHEREYLLVFRVAVGLTSR